MDEKKGKKTRGEKGKGKEESKVGRKGVRTQMKGEVKEKGNEKDLIWK